MSMFCYQCEQTAKGTGCTTRGVCGKDPDTAALQDLLLHVTEELARYGRRLRGLGVADREIDRFVLEALFTTVTNVNFNPERIETLIRRGGSLAQKARGLYEQACRRSGKKQEPRGPGAGLALASDLAGLVEQGAEFRIDRRSEALGADIAGLQELLTYGLKGTAAYTDHALILGQEDEKVFAFFHEALDYLAGGNPSVDALIGLCLRCGEVNLRAMELLDAAHTAAYGHPEPTAVRIEPRAGKAILVSGHDLKDLEELLKQTQGTGINVYTHGEMLPAHAYPGLKKYKHLAGNYGGAWQEQRGEFDEFPGAILMTTNCIQAPKESYKERIFTSGLVAWPGVTHLADRNFGPVIAAAREARGFEKDGPAQTITVGFGRNAVMGVAGKVIDAVKKGKIRRFFLIGGCDGAKPGRSYFTDIARAVPEDCVILTLACGKYRFNKLDFGSIDGIPRLLDMGQCNDAYSAIQVAAALAQAFQTGVNDLPLSLILSWYEQKAVCILLTLLHLGIQNIRIGPSLPAFVSPAVLDVLARKFNLKPITTPEADLAAILG